MRLSLLCLALVAFLNACGGGSSSSSPTTSSNNSESLKGLELSAGPAPGNGIWNYSVATDYYYGSQQKSPSLFSDIAKYDPQHTALKYVFPVFGNIQAGIGGNYIDNLSSSACFTDVSHTQAIFSYYALPQVQDRLSTGVYPSAPITPGKPFSDILGTCISGQTATSYYKNTVKIPYVVPVVEISDFSNYIGVPSSAAVADGKGSTLPSLGPTQVLAIADAIATMILQDPNAYGVAFDNELAINKATSPLGAPAANCTGMYYEQLFYGRIAEQLKASTPSKYLFLFDAPDSGTNLYTGASVIIDPTSPAGTSKNCVYDPKLYPPLPSKALTNIVLQKALYDLGSTDNAPPNGPISVQDNLTLATPLITSYLNTPNGPPVTFVLPASATSTMWESLQVYNLPALKQVLQNPKPPQPPTSIPISQAGMCIQDALNTSTMNYQVLSQYLCTAASSGKICLGPNSSSSLINSTISGYIDLPNCGSFTNKDTTKVVPTNVTMNQYFSSETSLITQTSTSGKSQLYLGSSLYAWRISQMSDFGGVPTTYSLLGPPSTDKPYSAQLFPMNISDDVWATFIAWAKSFPK